MRQQATDAATEEDIRDLYATYEALKKQFADTSVPRAAVQTQGGHGAAADRSTTLSGDKTTKEQSVAVSP